MPEQEQRVWWLSDDPGRNISRHFPGQTVDAGKTDILRRVYLVDSQKMIESQIFKLIKKANGDTQRLIELFEDKYSWGSHADILTSMAKGESLRRPIGIELESGAILGYNRILAGAGWHRVMTTGQIPMTKNLELFIQFHGSAADIKIFNELKKAGKFIYPNEDSLLIPITAFLPNKQAAGKEIVDAIIKEYNLTDGVDIVFDTGLDVDRPSAGQAIIAKGYAEDAKLAKNFNDAMVDAGNLTDINPKFSDVVDKLKKSALKNVVPEKTITNIVTEVAINTELDNELALVREKWLNIRRKIFNLTPPELLLSDAISTRNIEGVRDFWKAWLAYSFTPDEAKRFSFEINHLIRDLDFFIKNNTALPQEIKTLLLNSLLNEPTSLLITNIGAQAHEIANILGDMGYAQLYNDKSLLGKKLTKSSANTWGDLYNKYNPEKTKPPLSVFEDNPLKAEPVLQKTLTREEKLSRILLLIKERPELFELQEKFADILTKVVDVEDFAVPSPTIVSLSKKQFKTVTVAPSSSTVEVLKVEPVKEFSELPEQPKQHQPNKLWQSELESEYGILQLEHRIAEKRFYIVEVQPEELSRLVSEGKIKLAKVEESQLTILGFISNGVPLQDYPFVDFEGGVLQIRNGQNRIKYAIDTKRSIQVALTEEYAEKFAKIVNSRAYYHVPTIKDFKGKLKPALMSPKEAVALAKNIANNSDPFLDIARRVEYAKLNKLLSIGIDFGVLALDVFLFNKTKADVPKLDLSDDLLLTKPEFLSPLLKAKQDLALERKPFALLQDIDIGRILQSYVSGAWTKIEFDSSINEIKNTYTKLLKEIPGSGNKFDYHPIYALQRYELEFALSRIAWLEATGHDLSANLERIKFIINRIKDEFRTDKTDLSVHGMKPVTSIDDVMKFYKKNNITDADLDILDRTFGIKPSDLIWRYSKDGRIDLLLNDINTFENDETPISEILLIRLFSEVFPIIQDFTYTKLNKEQVAVFKERLLSNAINVGATAPLLATPAGAIIFLVTLGLSLLDVFDNIPDNVKLTRNALLMPELEHTSTSEAFNRIVDYVKQNKTFNNSRNTSVSNAVKEFLKNKYNSYQFKTDADFLLWYGIKNKVGIKNHFRRNDGKLINDTYITAPFEFEYANADTQATAETLFNIINNIDFDKLEKDSPEYLYAYRILNTYKSLQKAELDAREAVNFIKFGNRETAPQNYVEEWKASRVNALEESARTFMRNELAKLDGIEDENTKKFIAESQEKLAAAVKDQATNDSSNAIFNTIGEIYNDAMSKGFIKSNQLPSIKDIQPAQVSEIPVYTNINGGANKPTVTPGNRPIETEGQTFNNNKDPFSQLRKLPIVFGNTIDKYTDALKNNAKTYLEEQKIITNKINYAKKQGISLDEVYENIERAKRGDTVEFENLKKNNLLNDNEIKEIERSIQSLDISTTKTIANENILPKSFKEAEELNDRLIKEAQENNNSQVKARIDAANKNIDSYRVQIQQSIDKYTKLLKDIQNKYIDEVNKINQKAISDENAKVAKEINRQRETVSQAKSRYFSADGTQEKINALKAELDILDKEEERLVFELSQLSKNINSKDWNAKKAELDNVRGKRTENSKHISELGSKAKKETSSEFLNRTADGYKKANEDIYKYEKELEKDYSAETVAKLDAAKAAVAIWENEFFKEGSTYSKLIESNNKKIDAENKYKEYQVDGIKSKNRDSEKSAGTWTSKDETAYKEAEKQARNTYNKQTRETYQKQREALKEKSIKTAYEEEQRRELRNKYGVGGQGQGQKQNGHSYGCSCSRCHKLAEDIEKKRKEDEAQKYFAELARKAAAQKEKEEAEKKAKEDAEKAKQKADEDARKLKEELDRAIEDARKRAREALERLMLDGDIPMDDEYKSKLLKDTQQTIQDAPIPLDTGSDFINIHPEYAFEKLFNNKEPIVEPPQIPDIVPENLRTSPVKLSKKVVPTKHIPVVNPPSIPLNGPWINPSPSLIKKAKPNGGITVNVINPDEDKTDPGFIPPKEPIAIPDEPVKPPPIVVPDTSPIKPPEQIIHTNTSRV